MRQPHYVVASAPPEHGLYSVLDLWPYVTKRVADARLIVFADFTLWRENQDMANRYLVLQLEERLRTTPGVVQCNREGFLPALAAAGAFLYLTSYRDPSPQDALLAMKAGCRVVASSQLAPQLKRNAVLVPGDILNQGTRTGYVNALLHVLEAPEGPHKSPSLDREKIALGLVGS